MTRLRLTLLRLTLLGIAGIGGVIAWTWAFVAILADDRSPRAQGVILALDQTANAALGGSREETISSRAGRAELKGKRWACVLCRFLDRLQPNHCVNAINPEFVEKK